MRAPLSLLVYEAIFPTSLPSRILKLATRAHVRTPLDQPVSYSLLLELMLHYGGLNLQPLASTYLSANMSAAGKVHLSSTVIWS